MGLARSFAALAALAALAGAAAIALGACSDDPRPTENLLSVEDWAERFCASVDKIFADLADLADSGDLSFVSSQAAATPDQARGVQRRVRLHGPDLIRVLDQLATNLRDTGAPDIDGGQAFYNEIVQTVSSLRAEARTAIVTVSGLDLAEAEPREIAVLNDALGRLPSVVGAFTAALDGIEEADCDGDCDGDGEITPAP